MPFEMVSGVSRGVGVLDGGGDRRRGRGSLVINVGHPIVTNGDVCRCPRGRRLIRYEDVGGTASICEPINECDELGVGVACSGGGRCIDGDDGYRCECEAGRGGPTCAERRQQTRLADVSIRAGAIAIITVCLLLLMRQYSSSPIDTQTQATPELDL